MSLRVFIHGFAILFALLTSPAKADLRSAPAWYDQNAVSVDPDWHYRVPITIAAGATVNSTVKLDVNFTTLLATMGVTGSFDVNSPRVVRSTGALSTIQEFTDTVFAGATDAASNGQGEVRFILQDAGPVTYWLYFDITENGSKPVNPQAPINGNFERGSAGTGTPTGWTAPTGNATLDAQMVAGGTVSVTTNGGTPTTQATNGDPNSGQFSYLIGGRTNNEPSATRTITRTFTAPATALGSFAVRWKPQGWDSTGYDRLAITLTDSTTVTQVMGQTYGNYATAPFSPNSGGGAQSATVSGYGPYNRYDLNSAGGHTLGMTVTAGEERWWTRTVALPASYAGKTITVNITATHAASYKSWFLIDDVEWSVVAGTLGAPQGFGANITAPASGGTYVPGAIVPTTVQVDARPTAATNPLTAAFFTPAGVQIGGTFLLYNDGTHGDATANDGIWSNNNSIPAEPAPTVPLSATAGSNYVLRIYAKDGSSSSISAQNGLIRGPGTGAAAETQANFWNIDEILFTVQTAAITLIKSSTVLWDPVNLASNPKFIPGARVRYCILITNGGALPATSLALEDSIPVTLAYQTGTLKSGTTCAGATTTEDEDASGPDETDPLGVSVAGVLVNAALATLAATSSMAITLEALVQ